MAQAGKGLRGQVYSIQDAVRSRLDALTERLPAPVRRVTGLPLVQGLIFAVVAIVILAIAGPLSYTAYVVLLICVYLVAVYGLNITIGFSGVLSLGQGASFAFGAYISGILAGTYMWPIWATLPLSLAGGFLVGMLVGLPAGRLAALGLAMVSLGTVLVIGDLLVEFDEFTRGHAGISGIAPFLGFDGAGYIASEWFIPLLIVGFGFLAYWFHARYRTSWFGRATAAVRDESIGASALGISGYLTKVASFAVGSGMGGIAGGLFAYLSAYISPDAFSPALSILFLVMVVLGGLGSQLGPLIGVVMLVIIPLILAPFPHVNVIVYGSLLVLLMRLRPKGIFSRTAAYAEPLLRSLTRTRRSDARKQSGEVDREATGLQAIDVKRTFGGLKALDGVSLSVAPGEILGLIGPNGSGKTTMLNIIGGYYHPSEGSVLLDGEDISKLHPSEIARRGIARTFQTPKTFTGMSIDEHIELSVKWQLTTDPERVAACRAAAIKLLEYGGLDPQNLKIGRRESKYLAHGQLRFLETAMAVARCPKVLLLDEPAAGLSASEIDRLESVIKELASAGVSVIIVEHHLDMVSRLVDRIAVLDLGKLLWEGAPEDLHDAEAVRIAYMGTV